MNSQTLGFQELTRLNEDRCTLDLRNRTTVKPGDYRIKNYRSINCSKNSDILKKSVSQPMVIHRDGYGVSGCNIDIDSHFKNSHNLTNLKDINQLYERPYMTTPYMGRGVGDICKETQMNPGESTMQKRQCNNLAGINIDRFEPQISCIEKNIQNNIHLIPEDNDTSWVRGGLDSRQMIRNENYLKSCGYRYNSKFWDRSN